MLYIAIDIGGTNTRVNVFKELSIESEVGSERFPTERLFDDQVKKIIQVINELSDNKKISAISISQTGQIAPDKSYVLASSFCKDYEKKPMKQMLGKEFQCETYLENDAVCAGLAELAFGKHLDATRIGYITVSTGVNGMFIKALSGNRYQVLSPEFGHIKVKGDGRICQCGQIDCVQAYISGHSLSDRYLQDASQIKDLRVWEKAVEYLALATVNFVQMFSPTEIVFGGGMIENNDYIREKLQYEITSQLRDVTMPNISISTFGDKVAVYGALALLKITPESLI